jgi:hypothetical protein
MNNDSLFIDLYNKEKFGIIGKSPLCAFVKTLCAPLWLKKQKEINH